MLRNNNKTNDRTFPINSPIHIQATAWKDPMGNWKNLSVNMWSTTEDTEQSVDGIVLIRNPRLRDYARALRMVQKEPWYIDTHNTMKGMLEVYKARRHFAVNRIQLPVSKSYGMGRCAYTHTGCLFIEPDVDHHDPFAVLFINDVQYRIEFDRECSDKQKARGGVYTGEYNEVK